MTDDAPIMTDMEIMAEAMAEAQQRYHCTGVPQPLTGHAADLLANNISLTAFVLAKTDPTLHQEEIEKLEAKMLSHGIKLSHPIRAFDLRALTFTRTLDS